MVMLFLMHELSVQMLMQMHQRHTDWVMVGFNGSVTYL